jgi:hypothetical protein
MSFRRETWGLAMTLALAAPAVGAEPSRFGELQRACAAAADDGQRAGALERVLLVEGDGGALHVGSDGRMVFDFASPVAAEGGHVTLDGGDARAVATVRPEVAGALLKARAEGKLGARIWFRLNDRDGEEGSERPCTAVGGGDFVRVRATPLWVDLATAGRTIARATTAEGAVEPAAGATPRAEVAATVEGASGHDAELLVAAARELTQPALQCYRPAAKERRAGAIGLSVDVAPTGAVGETKVLIDGVRDPGVSRCLVRAARELRFPKTSHGGQVTASVALDLAPAK